MDHIHEVVIIGAGISGIGASRALSQKSVPHIILESRDRYGGRILQGEFAGTNLEIGATFIHLPKDPLNLVAKFIRDENIGTMPSLTNSEHFYYEDEGPLDHKVVKEAEEVMEDLEDSIDKKVEKSKQDLSLYDAASDFIKGKLTKEDKPVQDVVMWRLNM